MRSPPPTPRPSRRLRLSRSLRSPPRRRQARRSSAWLRPRPIPAARATRLRVAGAGRRPSRSSDRDGSSMRALRPPCGMVAVIVARQRLRRRARAGQTYTVLQCHPLNRAHADSILEDAPAYATRGFCGDPQNDHAIKVTSTADAQRPRSGRVRWPTGSRHLALVSVDLQAKLRRDNGHAARVWMADPRQNEVARVATGARGPTGYRHYSWRTRGHGSRQLVASLVLPEHGRLPAIRPREDLGAKRPAGGRRLLGSERLPLSTERCSEAAGFGARRTCALRPADSGSGVRRLLVIVNGERSRTSRMGAATRSRAPPTRRASQPCAGQLRTRTTAPTTARGALPRRPERRRGLRGRLRRQPDLRHPHREGRQHARRRSPSRTPRIPAIPS